MNQQTAKKLLDITWDSYEKIAEEFSQTRGGLWKDLAGLEKYLKKGDHVLDLGCGNGRLFELLKDSQIRYTGIDRSRRLIELARAKWPREKAEFLVGDGLDLSLPDGNIDLVYCIAVLQHIPSHCLRLRFLQNVRKALRPGGYLIMLNWNLWPLTLKKKSVWKYALEKMRMSSCDFKERFGIDKKKLGFRDCLTTWKGRDSSGVLYYHAFTLQEIRGLVKQSGFSMQEAYHIDHGRKVNWMKGGNLVIIAKNN